MEIKKFDIFDVHQENEPTFRGMATQNSRVDFNEITVVRLSDRKVFFEVDIENEIEKVICNINDLEEIVEKAWMYDDLNK